MTLDPQVAESFAEGASVRSLCLFSAPRFPARPCDVSDLVGRSEGPHAGDVAVARAERSLRTRFPGYKEGRGVWARPAEVLLRGLRLHVQDALDPADEIIIALEQIARACGLGVVDESLGEVMFPTFLDREHDLLDAATALVESGDGYLLCEGGPGDAYFVQALATRSDARVTVEAVGNRTLGPEQRLPRRRLADLRRLGWRPPRGSQPNYTRDLALDGDRTPQLLADLTRQTLEDVYGLEPGSRVVLCLALG